MTLWLLRIRTIAGRGPSARLLALGGVLAVLAMAAIWIDTPAARWVRDLELTGDVARLVRLAEVFAWGGSVLLIVLVAAVLDRRGWRVGLVLGAAALGSGLAADGVKLVIARTRPAATALETTTALETFVGWLPGTGGPTLLPNYGHATQSFPSAHAATAVGLAVGLSMLYPRGRWLFFVFALLACFQRLAAGAHFPSDVLAGAAMGCFGAGWVMRWAALDAPNVFSEGPLEEKFDGKHESAIWHWRDASGTPTAGRLPRG
jgi:membrane-associated phospholipid phosphatase